MTNARGNRELDDVAAGERASVRHWAARRTAPVGGSNRLLSVEELAAYLGVPKKTVYGCWRQWGLRGYRVGRYLRFRERQFQHYGPLDLWLAVGETAASVVNGSVLPVNELRKIELYPDHSMLPVDLKKQRFRSDIEYQMTIVTPGTYIPIRGDHLGVTRRCPLVSIRKSCGRVAGAYYSSRRSCSVLRGR